ncbi:MAG TPA: DUF2306 domain-containing protein [Bacillales bacterium]|nr:DUF2306 domain-containing protein [Bacillales bacterium]
MPLYQFLLIVHIIAGSICLVVGLCAALFKKRRGKHTRFGQSYHWFYVVVFLTAVVMAIMHWEQIAFLFYIALFSYSFACLGYLAAKIRWANWIKAHIIGMLGSYIGIVTAVLVTNGSHLSVFSEWPVGLFWILPTIIGSPIIVMVSRRFRSIRL